MLDSTLNTYGAGRPLKQHMIGQRLVFVWKDSRGGGWMLSIPWTASGSTSQTPAFSYYQTRTQRRYHLIVDDEDLQTPARTLPLYAEQCMEVIIIIPASTEEAFVHCEDHTRRCDRLITFGRPDIFSGVMFLYTDARNQVISAHIKWNGISICEL